MGGRGSGKSTAGSQYVASRLVAKEYFRCAIMRYVLGDIRNSIFQDIYDRIEEAGIKKAVRIREQLLTFQYGSNRVNGIGFKRSSGAQKAKLKSLANYSDVFIEEADEVSEPDFNQLDDSLRTTKSRIRLVLQLNPPEKNHWIIKRWFNLVEVPGVKGYFKPVLKERYKGQVLFIHTTYKNNFPNITESSRRNYENYKDILPDHYYNMIRGLVSEGKRGLIFPNWKPISAKEYEALEYKEYYGLDFGFTNDPTALMGIKEHNNRVYFRELLYEKGLHNADISNRFTDLGLSKQAMIYADQSEPKSISEIALHGGWNIHPCVKGSDSVRAGIDMLHTKEIYYVEDGENLLEEKDSYAWRLDRNKEPTNEPIDDFNHLMDAGRYGVFSKNHESFVGFV